MRLAQTANGSETRYLVDTQRSYSEVVGAITPESETWYLLGLDVLGQQQGSDWSYYAYDGLGSVRLALDSGGSPTAGMRYAPYGQPAARWGTPPALGFTGEWTDSSGLLYLRARYLDPSSATFLSRDPFEGLSTRALSRNGYSWVEGNPINYVDPSGEFPGVLVAAGAVGILLLLSALGQHMNQTRDTMPDLARALEDAFDDYCLPLSLIPGTGIALGIAQAAAGIAAGGADARAREQSNARATAQATAQANSTSIAPPMVTAVPTPEDNDDNGFDLAFGTRPYLETFAASFAASGERTTLWWWFWPNEMITKDGQMLRIANPDVLKSDFDHILANYFSMVPDGILKFNLFGMDNSCPVCTTTWELQKISSNPFYSRRTRYYEHNGVTTRWLSEGEAAILIRGILNN